MTSRIRAALCIAAPAGLALALLAQLPAGAASLSSAPSSAAVSPSGAAGKTVRISVAHAGQPNGISGRSARPTVDATGTVVAFDSVATDIVAGDSNKADDVFVRDLATGTTERVSVSSTGEQAKGGDSTRPSISGDGNLVAFDSDAKNLVPRDTNSFMDVFVRDRTSGVTTLVSRGRNSAPGNGASFGPAISTDGRYVTFSSDATNVVSTPVPAFDREVYVRDLVTGAMDLVSVDLDGQGAGGGSSSAAISADGRYVAYMSFASDIVPDDTNGVFDVFVRDRMLGTTTRVDVASEGTQASGGDSMEPSISADGRFVAFASDATTLVPGDTNGRRDIFVHDMTTGTTERVSVGADGVQANNQSDGPGFRGSATFGPSISGDGRYVTFDSIASNLVADDTNTCTFSHGESFTEPGECPDIFVRDRTAGVTTRVSVSSSGAQANDASTDPAISADGHAVAFFTSASNLAAHDTDVCQPFFDGHPGQCPDIYLHIS